jgi:hypothetical protein
MTSPKVPRDKAAELLEQLLEATQNLFILEALRAGAKGEAVRDLLHVNQWRVTNVSKLLNKRKDVSSH